MNITKENLEIVTMIAIIIAMACVAFKAFSWPLGNFLSAINPFNKQKRINQLHERVNEVESFHYEYKQNLISIEKKIKAITDNKKPNKK